MADHTGGVWVIEDIIYADYIALEAHVGDKILLIAADEYEEHGGGPTPEQAANFRLLSAAPELLRACEAALADGFRDVDIESWAAPLVAQLRAAIAKAKTGRASPGPLPKLP